MAGFIKGEVVVLAFPYSDLSRTKRRPALVISKLKGDDIILCQITSQNNFDTYSITLNNTDFEEGFLKRPSNIRPNRLFTIDQNIVLYKACTVTSEKIQEVIEKIIEIIKE